MRKNSTSLIRVELYPEDEGSMIHRLHGATNQKTHIKSIFLVTFNLTTKTDSVLDNVAVWTTDDRQSPEPQPSHTYCDF
jgi:hypothetical protein